LALIASPASVHQRHDGYELRIVKRKDRAFKVVGLTWIVERSFAWLGRYRRLSKDYEFWVQTSEAMIDLGRNPNHAQFGSLAHRTSRTPFENESPRCGSRKAVPASTVQTQESKVAFSGGG
jgi:transposase